MANNVNVYTKKATSAARFTRMRGVTDFSNAESFNVFETGFSFLFIISRPAWMVKLVKNGREDVKDLLDTFCYILENEFKGLDGLDDVTLESIEVSDGVSTINLIGKATKQSAAEVTMNFTERSGSAITKFLNYYIQNVRDPRTQARTYDGLIESGEMRPGLENDVFNMLYVVTDSTMLQVEKAYLLCNAFPNKAPTSIYNSTKGEIDKKEVDVTFQCFVIDGDEVDKRAVELLSSVNKVGSVANVYDKLYNNGAAAAAATSAPRANDDNQVATRERDFAYKIYSDEDRFGAGKKAAGNWINDSGNYKSTTD